MTRKVCNAPIGDLVIIAGGDEAGRGAVIGPLVVSIVTIQKGREGKLSRIGVRDSKLLTRKKRDYLYDEICSLAEDVKVYKISEEEINRAMAAGMSLNELEALHFARLIDQTSVAPERIYLDSPDVVSERFGIRVSLFSKRRLRVNGVKHEKALGADSDEKAIRVISEHKADIIYPVVSCASIISKVTRDNELDGLRERLGMDIGSGYPSDKITIDAIRANLHNKTFGQYMRERWKTLKNIRQSKIDDFFN